MLLQAFVQHQQQDKRPLLSDSEEANELVSFYLERERQRQRDRDGERQRQTERDRQKDRQKDRQTDRRTKQLTNRRTWGLMGKLHFPIIKISNNWDVPFNILITFCTHGTICTIFVNFRTLFRYSMQTEFYLKY